MILNKILCYKYKQIENFKRFYKTNKINLNTIILKNNLFYKNLLNNKLKNKPCIIGEIKFSSPSEGIIIDDKEESIIKIAQEYFKGNVCAISILTDDKFFNGSFNNLNIVSNFLFDDKTYIPTLCKDFICDKSQIIKARINGAHSILLIAKILTKKQITELYKFTKMLNMTPLIEIFDLFDLDKINHLDYKVIGINNRNLDTLEIIPNNAINLKSNFNENAIILSLSASKNPRDISLICNDLDGVLVGTSLMKSKKRVDFLNQI